MQSGNLSVAPWSPLGITSAAPTVVANATVAPDGTTTATRVNYPNTAAGGVSSINNNVSVTAAVYTYSVWAKGVVGGETIWLSVTTDGVTYYHVAYVALTTSWQRFAVTTGTLTAATWVMIIGVDQRDNPTQTPQPAQSVYLWGAQIELGTFPTSYIPTTAASVTRAQDSCAIPPANMGFFVSPGGSWMAEFIQLNTSGANMNTRIIGAPTPGGGGATPLFSNTLLQLSQYDNSAAVNTANAITANTVSKGASNWVSGTGRLCLNGGAVASGAMANGFAALTTNGIKLFTTANPGVIENGSGCIRHVGYWSRTLSDAELQTVTR